MSRRRLRGGGTYIENFYKMTRVENWWTRSNATLDVWNADFLWGVLAIAMNAQPVMILLAVPVGMVLRVGHISIQAVAGQFGRGV